MKLVENANQRLKEEEEVIELSVEEQKNYFKGWMIAKAAEDSAYLSNNIEDISNDFKDDATPCCGPEAITLEPMEFDDEIKTMKEKLESTPEEGGEEAPIEDEPVADEIGEPVGDEAGEPAPEEEAPAEEGLMPPAEAPEEEDAVDEDIDY